MLQNSTNILALLTVLVVVIIILKMFVSAIIESRRNQKMEEARGFRASMINTERDPHEKYGAGKRSTTTGRFNSRTSYGSMITRQNSSLKTRNHKLSSSSSETSQTNTNSNNSSQKTSCSLNSTPSIIISDTEDSNKDNILLIDHSRGKGSGRSRNLPSINFQLGTLEEEEDSSC